MIFITEFKPINKISFGKIKQNFKTLIAPYLTYLYTNKFVYKYVF